MWHSYQMPHAIGLKTHPVNAVDGGQCGRSPVWQAALRPGDEGGASIMNAWVRAAGGGGWWRILGLVAAMGICAPAALAQPLWEERYATFGVALGRQDLGLDTLSASVNGRSAQDADWAANAALVGLGYRRASGPLLWGAEAELQAGAGAIALHRGCRLGQNCAGAGLEGRIGPIFRLRAVLGRVIGPGRVLSAGLGLSLADVEITHAHAQAASAQGGSAVITTARSAFDVRDRALGYHLMIGVEQRVTRRGALRLDLVHDRLQIENARQVLVLTSTASGGNSATAQIAQDGGFGVENLSVRLSLVLRF